MPLDEQDTTLWDAELIARGEAYLRRAHAFGRLGRFQLEAAIQSVHCARAVSGQTDSPALRKLYEALVRVAPTLGARVSLAAIIGQTDGPLAGLAVLDAVDDPAMARFQPAWATRAHLLVEAGRVGHAGVEDDADWAARAALAFERAIALTTDAGIREYLRRKARIFL